MSEKSNKDLCFEFMELLTSGFFIEGELACSDLMDTEQQTSEVLQRTKPWRNAVWKKFYEIEERLCPRPPNAPRPDYVKAIIAKGKAASPR